MFHAIFMICLLLVVPVNAQNNNIYDLFPELRPANTPTETVAEPTASEDVLSPVNAVSNEVSTPLVDAPVAVTEMAGDVPVLDEEESEEDYTQKRILLILDDVDNVEPPSRQFSFCRGKMIVENQLGMALNALNVTLNFSPLTADLAYSGVARNQRQEQSFTIVGRSCANVLSPQIDITACQVDGMTEEACKKRVEFVPIQ